MKATVGRIWEAASSEKTRPVLMHVSFDAKKATLTATNSYIAVRVPCEVEDGDESGLIPATAIKEANGKSLRVAGDKATLVLPDGGERTWPLLTGQKWPDVDKILAGTPESQVRFGVNPSLLNTVGIALGAGATHGRPIELHPVHPLKGMLIRAGEGVGVLMPVRLPNTNGHALPTAPDLSNDDIVLAAVEAAVAKLNSRRGRKRAAQAFRDTLAGASQAA